MKPMIVFEKDFPERRIVVTTRFKAPLHALWDAFTNSEILEKWFAPKPYRVVTKKMDFSVGGKWLYHMLSPDGQQFWSVAAYKAIQPGRSYVALDAFCDEHGEINTDFPHMIWTNVFSEYNQITTVTNTILYEEEKDMRQILEMGFEEGYKMGLFQLQEWLDDLQG